MYASLYSYNCDVIPSVKVAALPPTLFILFLHRCSFPCETYIGSVASQLLAGSITTPFLVPETSVIGMSKVRE